MRITGPKAKLCRAYGINLFRSPKYDKILGKKPSRPGIHGMKRKKFSQYGEQLRAKQIARLIFGLSEKQFAKYVNMASKQDGDTGENLLRFLETRADNVVMRAGFAETTFQARQMVNHGHFELNGKKISTPSIKIKIGDKLTVRDNKKKSKLYEVISSAPKKPKDKAPVPSWLKADPKGLQIEMVALPDASHFDSIIDTKPIVEFYSR